jgi:hypothetical protein
MLLFMALANPDGVAPQGTPGGRSGYMGSVKKSAMNNMKRFSHH